MNTLPSLFLNETVIENIEEFCASDPEFAKTKQGFYKIAGQIEELAGPGLYDAIDGPI